MIELIKKYRDLSLEVRSRYFALFSLISNAVLATFKIILSVYKGVFFLVSGLINVIVIVSKLMCYQGLKDESDEQFKKRNIVTGIFIILMGIQYGIYMSRMIFTNIVVMNYGMRLGIIIACVSFVEMGIAIRGLFKGKGRNRYFHNLKVINFCSAMTAMVLTAIAITSFASEDDPRIFNGILGLVVSTIIVFIGVYVLIIPRYSIVGKEVQLFIGVGEQEVLIPLTSSKIYGNYYYQGKKEGEILKGYIYQDRSPIYKWNIVIKIIVIVLSEILIFPYMLGALINSFKGNYIIKKLNKKMKLYGGNNISTYLT